MTNTIDFAIHRDAKRREPQSWRERYKAFVQEHVPLERDEILEMLRFALDGVEALQKGEGGLPSPRQAERLSVIEAMIAVSLGSLDGKSG